MHAIAALVSTNIGNNRAVIKRFTHLATISVRLYTLPQTRLANHRTMARTRVRNGERGKPRVVRTSARVHALLHKHARSRTKPRITSQQPWPAVFHNYVQLFGRTEALHKSSTRQL